MPLVIVPRVQQPQFYDDKDVGSVIVVITAVADFGDMVDELINNPI